MATLTIRDFPDELRDRLRVQSAEAGRSMEAEVRAILTRNLSQNRPEADTLETSLQRLQAWVAQQTRGTAGEASTVEAFIRDKRRDVILEVIEDGDDPEQVFGAEFERICREAEWTPEHVRGLRGRVT